MKVTTITIGGRPGSLFEGEALQTFCFVPSDCISAEGDNVHILEGDYVRSGWDVRNMRFNDAGEGQHLFPNTRRPVSDFESEKVRVFLHRIESVHAA